MSERSDERARLRSSRSTDNAAIARRDCRRARRRSRPARPGCGRARSSSKRSTCCSWTRPARCRWPTCWRYRRPQKPRPARRSSAARAADAGQPPRRYRRLGARAPPRRAQDDPARARPLPRPRPGGCIRAICAFTSELFYEGRLRPRAGLERQMLDGDRRRSRAPGCGLCRSRTRATRARRPRRSSAVARSGAGLTGGGVALDRRDGDERRPLTLRRHPDHRALQRAGRRSDRRACPSARIGTVDKFQGQEAPVVIYSMTTSSPEDAPRGMEFLYSPNRLNVATSRARCACILVGEPAAVRARCRTPGADAARERASAAIWRWRRSSRRQPACC